MDPFSLIGALASGAGGLIGAGESARANADNREINQLNFLTRMMERADQIRMAERARADTMLGATDGRGTRVRFVEGKGWVTELSPEAEAIQNAEDRERAYQLGEDLTRRRDVQRDNEARRLREGSVADALLEEFENLQRVDPNALRRQMATAARTGVNEAFDAQAGNAMRTALRTGASNSGQVLADINKQRSGALSSALQQAFMASRGAAESEFTNNRANLANLYGAFADRATRLPDASFQPQNIATTGGDMLKQFAAQFGGDNRFLAQSHGKQGGTLDYVQPDYGMANALAGIGNNLAGLGRESSARSDLEERRKQIRSGGSW